MGLDRSSECQACSLAMLGHLIKAGGDGKADARRKSNGTLRSSLAWLLQDGGDRTACRVRACRRAGGQRPTVQRGGLGAQGGEGRSQYKFYFNIGSIDSFERKMEEAQEDLGWAPGELGAHHLHQRAELAAGAAAPRAHHPADRRATSGSRAARWAASAAAAAWAAAASSMWARRRHAAACLCQATEFSTASLVPCIRMH